MPAASNPARALCEEMIRLEIARVGTAEIDRSAMLKRCIGKGASRSRAQDWIRAMVAEAEAREAAAPALAAARAAEEAETAALEAARRALADQAAAKVEAMVLPDPEEMAAFQAEAAAVIGSGAVSLVPDSAGGVLEHLQTIMATCTRVLEHSHDKEGKVRNVRFALQSVETLRRTLETALKLYEQINNVQQVERFMAEMIAAVRPIAPEVAAVVVERMRAVQARWAT